MSVELLFCMKLFTNGEIPSNASTKIQLKLTERPLDINLMVSAAILVREWHVTSSTAAKQLQAKSQ